MQCDKTTAKNRSSLIQKIRDFFVHADFLEVETPIMTPIPGMEPHLTPFESRLNFPSVSNSKTADLPVYLNTSPELQMKKLLGAGFDKIFNITKVFRNGEMDGPLHNPEFTMIEWYRKNADYKDLMKDCEELILELVKINRLKSPAGGEAQNDSQTNQDSQQLSYQSENIDLSTPWPRFTTNELFIKYCDIDLLKNQDFATFKKATDEFGKKHGHENFSSGCENWDDLYFKIFLNNIEPELTKLSTPIFIYDYPSTQAALAKKSSANPFFAERFELYIKGIELANAFSELTDSKEQHTRLIEEQNLRKTMGKTILPIDKEFLSALDHITVPTAGIALGLDRLLMLLLDKKSIEEVMLFPMNKMAN